LEFLSKGIINSCIYFFFGIGLSYIDFILNFEHFFRHPEHQATSLIFTLLHLSLILHFAVHLYILNNATIGNCIEDNLNAFMMHLSWSFYLCKYIYIINSSTHSDYFQSKLQYRIWKNFIYNVHGLKFSLDFVFSVVFKSFSKSERYIFLPPFDHDYDPWFQQDRDVK